MKKIFTLIAAALFATGMWGEDATFTMASIFDGNNQAATVTSPVDASVSTTTNKSNAPSGKLGSDGNYFQVVLTSRTFTAASINGCINTSKTDKNWGFQFSTDGGKTWATEQTQANDGNKSAHDITVGVTIPSGANGFRVIRRAGTSTVVNSITLTLVPTAVAPAITAPTADQDLVEYTVGDAITALSVTATGSPAPTYQWYSNATKATGGNAIEGATSASYTPSNAEESDLYYYCVATNASGSATSPFFHVSVAAAPTYNATYTSDKGSTPDGETSVAYVELPQIAAVTGFIHTAWTADVATKVAGETVAAGTEIAIGTTVFLSSNTTFTAVWDPTFTITLNPAGGTTTDESWTLDGGKYTKIVASGASVALPEFTKAGRAFKEWRNALDEKVTSPVTVDADVTLTAIWTKDIDVVIYSWEGAKDGAIEVGGTATSTPDGGTNFDNAQINVLQADYYCLQMNGKKDYSTNYIEIAVDENVKAGDSIKYIGFYNNADTKNAAPKMRAADGTAIFTGAKLPNITTSSAGTYTYLVPTGINTAKVQLTRDQTQSSSFIPKLQIIRPTAVEEANIATITFNSNGGSSVAAIELIKGNAAAQPADPTKDGYLFAGWYLNDVAYDWSSTVSADITLVAHWSRSFTVSYYDGETKLGEEDVVEGENPANYATYETKTHYKFDAWKNNAAVIIDVASLIVTKDTALYGYWTEKEKAAVTFRVDGDTYGSVQNVYVGEKVASVDAPTKAGNVFKGWYNGENKFDFTTALASDDAIALDASWEAADANHYVYAYNDDIRFDGAYYHTPEGKAANQSDAEATKNLTTPYTLFTGAGGITSIIETNGIYDFKKGTNTKHVTSYLKLKKDDATSNLAITIATGYTAVLKIKMGGYSNNPTVTLKKGDDVVDATSGTIGGTAEGKNYNEITYKLTAGTYVLTSADQTLYMSNIDLEATPIRYDITIDGETVNGTVGIDGGAASIAYGTEVTLTNTPEDGYVLDAYVVYKTGDTETKVTVTEGKFTMPAYAVTISGTFKESEPTAIDNTEVEGKAVKVIRNGQLVIEKNGKTYTVTGLEVR